VQTLLKATNANVCASIVLGRSFFANTSGMATAERNNCGAKARDSRRRPEVPPDVDVDVDVVRGDGELER